MISLCLPTRGRPRRFHTMYESALATAQGEIEVVAVYDEDDGTIDDYPEGPIYVQSEPGSLQSSMWNQAWAHASGDIAHMCADDLIFRTPGWDRIISKTFLRWMPDRIGMVFVNDKYPLGKKPYAGQTMRDTDGQGFSFAANPFVTREWIDAAGTFTPPYYQSWESDTWIYLLAESISRAQYLHGVVIEHMHPMVQGQDGRPKAEMDETYQRGAWGNEHMRRAGWLRTKSPRMRKIRAEQTQRLTEAIQSYRLENVQ